MTSDELEKNVTTVEVSDPSDEKLVIETIQGSDDLAEAMIEAPPKYFSKNMLLLYLACLPGYLCGTLAGYDGSVMGSFLTEDAFDNLFGADVVGFEAGYITAMYQIGGVVAILFIAESMDRWGRRFGIFIGSLFTVLGAILQGLSAKDASLNLFMAGRFFLGFGSTIAQQAGSTYVVEISHPALRGTMTGGQTSMINLGSVLAASVTLGTSTLSGNSAWLIPTYSQLICPGLACLIVFFFPESPRWQYTHNKQETSKKFLIKYHGENDPENPYVRLQIAEFEHQLNLDGSDKKWWDYRILFSTRSQRYRLWNCLFIGIWGSLSNGGLSYFFGAFLTSAGITNERRILVVNAWCSFLGACASYIGAVLCDYIGRRTLLLPTLAGMGFSWIGLAVGAALVEKDPSNTAAGNAGIAFYFIFVFIYCLGITPLQGVYYVEVFSYEQRAKGMGFSNLIVSATNLINQFATPVAIERIAYKFYIILAAWNFFEFGVSYLWSVETKGYTLEELDAIFEAPNPRKASTQKRKVIVDADQHLVKVAQA